MITKISENFYRGPLPEFEALKKLGVNAIIGLQNGGDNEELIDSRAMKMYLYDFDLPGLWPPQEKTLRDIVGLIHDLLISDAFIYVHCTHGRERTGLVVAAHRILNQFWKPERAIEEMIQMGSRWPYSWFASNLLRKL